MNRIVPCDHQRLSEGLLFSSGPGVTRAAVCSDDHPPVQRRPPVSLVIRGNTGTCHHLVFLQSLNQTQCLWHLFRKHHVIVEHFVYVGFQSIISWLQSILPDEVGGCQNVRCFDAIWRLDRVEIVCDIQRWADAGGGGWPSDPHIRCPPIYWGVALTTALWENVT